jgi:hypothetical protein
MVFLVCFACAAIFWLLKNLSSTFNHTIKIPISLVNYPQDWIVYSPEQDYFQVNVRGRGFQLIQWTSLNADPFEIDLRQMTYQAEGSKAYMLTNHLVPAVFSYLGSKIEWDGQLQDTLHFKADQRVQKEVFVRFHGSMSAEKDSVLVHYELTPNQVSIRGPKSKLKELDTISTIEAHFELLHNNLTTKLALTVPGCDSCVLSPNQVELKISLEELPSVE